MSQAEGFLCRGCRTSEDRLHSSLPGSATNKPRGAEHIAEVDPSQARLRRPDLH